MCNRFVGENRYGGRELGEAGGPADCEGGVILSEGEREEGP